MMQTLWDSREIVDEMGQVLRLEYYLLTEVCEGMDQYGVEIRMYRGDRQETANRLQVAPQASRATDLLSILARNTVTPTTLGEILEDLL